MIGVPGLGDVEAFVREDAVMGIVKSNVGSAVLVAGCPPIPCSHTVTRAAELMFGGADDARED